METYTIDAKGKKLGRIATEAARALMGKHKPSYAPNAFPETQVLITGADAIVIDEKKAAEKIFTSYSGHPGGLKEVTMSKVIEKRGVGEVLRRAIRGMLPPNKLRARRLKLLTIER